MQEWSRDIANAFKEIHFFRGIIPVKAYQVLAAHKEEVTPVLIQLVKDAIQHRKATGDYYVAHIHAILLLSQFKEKKAYPLVIEVLNLPVELIDRLIGDMLTEIIPKIILSIYDGNPEPLFELLINHKSDFALRVVIGTCFSALIYQKMIESEIVLKRLQEVVARGKKNQDPDFYSALAILVIECKFEPLYDTLRAAFKAKLVNNHCIDLASFEQGLLQPIEKLVREQDLHPLTDAIKEMENWEGYSYEKSVYPKIERNGLCPCGSGFKFKKCCISLL